MELTVFLLSAALISLSGVLSPGPMTAAVIQQGARSRLSGVYVSLGHGAIEIPLIVFISMGANKIIESQGVQEAIGIAGGLYLFYMARGLLDPPDIESLSGEKAPSSFLSGIFLSMANPYFLLWWATIGLGLVLGAVKFGILGLALFALVHWLCDLVWYSLLSNLSFKGVRTFGARLYRRISIFCGLAMLGFGGLFIYNSVRLLIED